MKVSIVGAGAVGATCADNIARLKIAADVVLLDIKEGIAEGKAIDIAQTAALSNFNTRIVGVTNNYEATAKSDVVVITSGLPRKPGMTREELIGVNAGIVEGVAKNILTHSPQALIIIVSNPMDTMTYLTLTKTGISPNRVIGMGGILDTARFKFYLSQALSCSPNDLNAIVIGGHGDTTMIPLIRFATWNSVPVTHFLSADQQKQIVADTMVGGATLTKHLGTSAWIAPGAAVGALVKSILLDEKRLFSCCVSLNGAYNQNDICLGVPVVIGKNGWEKIIDFKLNAEELATFNQSAQAVRSMNEVLKSISN